MSTKPTALPKVVALPKEPSRLPAKGFIGAIKALTAPPSHIGLTGMTYPALSGSGPYHVTAAGVEQVSGRELPAILLPTGGLSVLPAASMTAVLHGESGHDVTTTEFSLPLGLTILFGPPGAGKSFIMASLHKLMEENDVAHLVTGEPTTNDGYDVPPSTVFCDDTDYGIAVAVKALLSGTNKKKKRGETASTLGPVLLIDSLRNPLYEASGSAGEKGIINTFFTAITRLSNALALQGVRAIALLNPMQADDSLVQLVRTRLESALPATLELRNLIRDDTGVYAMLTIKSRLRSRKEATMKLRLSGDPVVPGRNALYNEYAAPEFAHPDDSVFAVTNVITGD